MTHNQIRVPFGYVAPKASVKGTMFVYDPFEDWIEGDLEKLLTFAREKSFAGIVLFPQHEETLRRMGIPCSISYFQRIKNLEKLVQEVKPQVKLEIDAWEGKRKKYTPLDTSLRFLTDKHQGPYFLCINDHYANLFASYSSFDEWIKKLRMIVNMKYQVPLHPKLSKYEHRWESVSFSF